MKRISFLTTFSSFKGEPMRLNDLGATLSAVLRSVNECFDGKLTVEGLKEAVDKVLKDNPPLTLRDVCVTALTNPQQPEKDGMKKFRRGHLAHEIAKNDELELPAEDITLLKQVVNEAYPSPVIIWNAWGMLDAEPGQDETKPN